MASIEKRTDAKGNVKFRVKIRIKGHPIVTATFPRLTDARRWVQQTEVAINDGKYFKPNEAKRHTLSDLIQRYIKDVLPQKPKSKKNYIIQLRWWNKQIGDYLLCDITPALISECRDKLLNTETSRGKKMAPATVVRYLAALSTAVTTAVSEWAWLEENPVNRVKRPKEPRGIVRFLSEDEIGSNGMVIEGERTRLLKAAKLSPYHFMYPIIVLALATGARKSEIINLRWKDINFKQQVFILHNTKNGERRTLPLVNHAYDIITDLSRVRNLRSDLLFPSNQNPKRPVSIRLPWEKILTEAEVKNFRFHDLRHSAASYLAMNGASMMEIADVLGHKSPQMVMRYAHLSDTYTSTIVNSMNNAIFK